MIFFVERERRYSTEPDSERIPRDKDNKNDSTKIDRLSSEQINSGASNPALPLISASAGQIDSIKTEEIMQTAQVTFEQPIKLERASSVCSDVISSLSCIDKSKKIRLRVPDWEKGHLCSSDSSAIDQTPSAAEQISLNKHEDFSNAASEQFSLSVRDQSLAKCEEIELQNECYDIANSCKLNRSYRANVHILPSAVQLSSSSETVVNEPELIDVRQNEPTFQKKEEVHTLPTERAQIESRTSESKSTDSSLESCTSVENKTFEKCAIYNLSKASKPQRIYVSGSQSRKKRARFADLQTYPNFEQALYAENSPNVTRAFKNDMKSKYIVTEFKEKDIEVNIEAPSVKRVEENPLFLPNYPETPNRKNRQPEFHRKTKSNSQFPDNVVSNTQLRLSGRSKRTQEPHNSVSENMNLVASTPAVVYSFKSEFRDPDYEVGDPNERSVQSSEPSSRESASSSSSSTRFVDQSDTSISPYHVNITTIVPEKTNLLQSEPVKSSRSNSLHVIKLVSEPKDEQQTNVKKSKSFRVQNGVNKMASEHNSGENTVQALKYQVFFYKDTIFSLSWLIFRHIFQSRLVI